MDPIAQFLQSAPSPQSVSATGRAAKKLFLPVFTNAHSRLTLTQMNKGFITYDDLLQSLNYALNGGSEITASPEVTVYAGVIYESSFQPAMLGKGPGFILSRDLTGNEANFLRAVVQVLMQHSNGKENLIVEDFKVDVAAFLKKAGSSPPTAFYDQQQPPQQNYAPALSPAPLPVTSSAKLGQVGQVPPNRFYSSTTAPSVPPITTSGFGSNPSLSMDFQNRSTFNPAPTADRTPYNQFNGSGMANSPSAFAHQQLQQQQYTPSSNGHNNGQGYHSFGANPPHWSKTPTHRSNFPGQRMGLDNFAAANVAGGASGVGGLSIPRDIEKSEPIIRLLAHLRKSGMDILFPQIIHDKILMCIYVAMTCTSSLTHRELIDMVMSIKDSHVLTQIDTISKTKIRGVLALLKHGQLFLTKGEEGEAVQLYLAEDIRSFRDLREKHDAFLSTWILQHHLYIPAVLKGELLWQLDPETKLLRLEELKGLEQTVEHYYLNVYQPSFSQSDASSGGGGASPSMGMSNNNRQIPLSSSNGWSDMNYNVSNVGNVPVGISPRAVGNDSFSNTMNPPGFSNASRVIGGSAISNSNNNNLNGEGLNYSSLFSSGSSALQMKGSNMQFDVASNGSLQQPNNGLFLGGAEDKQIDLNKKENFLGSNAVAVAERDNNYSYWASTTEHRSESLLNNANGNNRFSEHSIFSSNDLDALIDRPPAPVRANSKNASNPSSPPMSSPHLSSPNGVRKEFNPSVLNASETPLF